MKTVSLATLFGMVLSAMACGGQLPIGDLGTDDWIENGGGGGPSSNAGGSSGNSGGPASPATDAGQGDARPIGDELGPESPILGRWEGYAENTTFEDGSDSIVVTLELGEGGALVGHVVFGQRSAPPAATDGNAYYPPGATSIQTGVYSGYSYSATQTAVNGSRVRFVVRGYDLYKSWCALQTPVSAAPDQYACVPYERSAVCNRDTVCTLTDPESGATTTVPFPKFEMCGGFHVCDCNATGCTASNGAGASFSFDMALNGNRLEGSAELPSGRANVHLVRRP